MNREWTKVFICSTYADLADERREIEKALSEFGCLSIGTETLPVTNAAGWKTVKQSIDECDLVLLIIAGRYGSMGINDQGERTGYIEMEFDYAVQIEKPILTFIHNHPGRISDQQSEQTVSGMKRLDMFRKKVENGRIVKYWKDSNELKKYIIKSVHNYLENNTTISSQEIFDLLCRIDLGGLPTEGEINLLRNCHTLDLKGSKITTIPDTIFHLQHLRRLDLQQTNISSFPESFWRLSELKYLDLGFTKIQELPSEIGRLRNLEQLCIQGSKLHSLPESIGNLLSLRILILSDTSIDTLPDSIMDLSALQILYLSGTKIKEVPKPIEALAHLQVLNISRTLVPNLPDFIGNLSDLQVLALRSTPIQKLPQSLKNLVKLRMLDLGGSSIGVLPSWIGDLNELSSINLNELILPAIPKSLALRKLPFVELYTSAFMEYIDEFPNSRDCVLGISMTKTILLEQSKSIFIQTPALISSLYQETEYSFLRESRVIFLGDGEAGKSYTIKRIRNNGRKETKNKPYLTSETPGVEILNYHIEKDADSFNIHFWDFGGQQLLHSMHRCFLSEESCYVIVVKTRETKANERARYWLRNVMAFAPNSPVLLFVNCWENDDGKRAIDEPGLTDEFKSIKKVIYCSAKQASDEEFRERVIGPIVDMATTSEWVSKAIPQSWVSIRRVIESISKNNNYLTREHYHELCSENGIDNEHAPTLLSYFNHLGICFSYHLDKGEKELAEYKLLSPVWLTNALYAIIEEGRAHATEGRINRSAIKQMLCNRAPEIVHGKEYRRTVPDLQYKAFECPFIVDVAIAHDLCYPIDNTTLFFPALCDTDSPEEALSVPESFSRHVSYLLRYEYLPDSVLHRLMIRCMQNHLSVEKCWLRGMVLYVWDLHRIIVRMVGDENLQIDIYSTGEHRAYELFWVLCKQIEEINRQLNLRTEEYIMDGKADFLLEDVVAALEESGFVSRRGIRRNARELLGDFFDESVIQSLRVENGVISISAEKRHYTSFKKNNEALRLALYEAYHRICPYCGNPLNYREMEVDHIFPARFQAPPALKPYIDYLDSCGFSIDKPDYIENYFPTHGHCNRDKSNRINEFTLPYWHLIAAQRSKKVLALTSHFEKQSSEHKKAALSQK